MWKTQNIANNEKVEVDTEQQYNYLTTRIMFINIKLTNFKAAVKKNQLRTKQKRNGVPVRKAGEHYVLRNLNMKNESLLISNHKYSLVMKYFEHMEITSLHTSQRN